MFSSALRSQSTRLGLRAATAGVPRTASRSLASLVSRQALVPAPTARSTVLQLATRAFSRSASVAQVGARIQGNPPNNILFVGNLPWSATEDEIRTLFEEFGEVTNIKIHTHLDGRPRGFAHIDFATKEQAIGCFTSGSEEPLYFGGRDLVLDYARPRNFSGSAELLPNNRLYFSGFKDGENALKQLLGNHADNLISIFFLKDGQSGERLPTGFLEFKNVPTATDAVAELNGTDTPSGDRLVLQYARPQRQRDGEDGDRRRGNPRMGNGKREHYTKRSWSNNKSDY